MRRCHDSSIFRNVVGCRFCGVGRDIIAVPGVGVGITLSAGHSLCLRIDKDIDAFYAATRTVFYKAHALEISLVDGVTQVSAINELVVTLACEELE
jgi:hypothetical protein